MQCGSRPAAASLTSRRDARDFAVNAAIAIRSSRGSARREKRRVIAVRRIEPGAGAHGLDIGARFIGLAHTQLHDIERQGTAISAAAIGRFSAIRML